METINYINCNFGSSASKKTFSGKNETFEHVDKEKLTVTASCTEQVSLKVQLWVFVRNVLGSHLGQRTGCSD